MNKKILNRLLISCAIGLIATTAAVSISFSWLFARNTLGDIEFSSGNLTYSMNTDMFTSNSNYVVPGQNLFAEDKKITITNSSTITSNLRIKVEYSFTKTGVTTVTGTDLTPSVSTNYLISNSIPTEWVYSNGYYYYLAEDPLLGSIEIPSTTTTYDFISDLTVSGVVGNEYQGSRIDVTITFEAKQVEYLTWQAADSLNYTTGV